MGRKSTARSAGDSSLVTRHPSLLVIGKELLRQRHAGDPVAALRVVDADAAEFLYTLLAGFPVRHDQLVAAVCQLGAARQLEEMMVDVGLRERRAADEGAVVLEDHHPLVAERGCESVGAFARGVV